MKFSLLFMIFAFFMNSLAANTYPFHFISKNRSQNKMQLLNSGLASFQKRIDLIRKARKSISIEYFIWNKDDAGLMIFHELIKKAKKGIKVRILLDKSITIIEIDEFYAEYLAEKGIEIKYYNRALDPSTMNYRTHRKLLIIDEKEVITGGRNIGDEYFDLDPVYNYIDRDLWVRGPIAKAAEDSFNILWKHPMTVRAKVFSARKNSNRIFRGNRRGRRQYRERKDKNFQKLRKQAREWLNGHSRMKKKIARIEKYARKILKKEPIYSCPKATFVSDMPGGNIKTRLSSKYKESYRVTRKELMKRLMDPKVEELLIVSPYFILNDDWKKVFNHHLVEKGTPVSLYTNSLGSTDASYVGSAFYRIIFDLIDQGLKTYVHNGKYPGITDLPYPKIKKVRWGVHSKTQVYDKDSFYIGTYNVDNRSDFYNMEMGVFCDGNEKMTTRLKSNIKKRLKQAYHLKSKTEATDHNGNSVDAYGNATRSQIKAMKIVKYPAWLLEFLM